jgi:hypothetical protein
MIPKSGRRFSDKIMRKTKDLGRDDDSKKVIPPQAASNRRSFGFIGPQFTQS